ncbi:BREX protein BrxB domain-containing protein [Candidatus Poriferisodalis sp.]|uniref:BREX protein BrxB domain-containing protein n=1 Tax=Candidatus Poriferisodalis sp. TaxID=3101277 RepID=UPI003B013B80
MPLPEPVANIAERIVSYYETQATVPFFIYQYEPQDEYAVRRELNDLRMWLEADPRNIECDTVSLADVFWKTLEEGGQLDEIINLERAGAYEEAQLAVRQVLSARPTFADRVVDRVQARQTDRSAIFLYRAGALYPAHRTSTLLDELKARIDSPVTLLYPGSISGDYGLRFMGKTEPTYGYRALIIPRGES